MSNRTINHRVPDLQEFFSFAREAETSIVKLGRSAPTTSELDTFSYQYWRAVDELHDRLRILHGKHPMSDRVAQEFVNLTLRCEAAWRSRIKPRGYSGDYRVMELFYELDDPCEQKSHRTASKAPGERLVEGAFSNTHGVRLIYKRAKMLETFLVEQIGKSKRQLKILDVGGGGAKYFRRAAAKVANKAVSYTIFDLDSSLPLFWQHDVCENISKNVRVVSAPVKALLGGGHPEVSSEKFDVILSSGLFDYLEQDVAQQLAGHLFSLLHQGGKLVIANMLDSEPAQAAFFRETLMDWKIVTRSDEQMHNLLPHVKAEKYQRFPDVDLGVIHFTRS